MDVSQADDPNCSRWNQRPFSGRTVWADGLLPVSVRQLSQLLPIANRVAARITEAAAAVVDSAGALGGRIQPRLSTVSSQVENESGDLERRRKQLTHDSNNLRTIQT